MSDVESPISSSIFWGLCALFDLHFRVAPFEVIVKQFQMAHNAKPVCYNHRFLCITEMPIDVLLLYSGIAGGIFRHKCGSASNRIKSRIHFGIGRRLPRFCLSKLGIIFRNITLDSCRVVRQHIRKCFVHLGADRFRHVYQVLKHIPEVC